jgi:hypoxanthine phosphoribosyltransferase
MTVDEANQVLSDAELLADVTEVEVAISRMAEEISERLNGSLPVIICVMNGGLIFGGQLLTRLQFPLEVDYAHATRYGAETAGGSLFWKAKPMSELQGRVVLLLDDILDEGVTLSAIADYCLQQGAEQVLTAVLVDKQHDRKVKAGLKADFTGIETADRFLFGYGLDYKGFWRNAPGIYAVKPS